MIKLFNSSANPQMSLKPGGLENPRNVSYTAQLSGTTEENQSNEVNEDQRKTYFLLFYKHQTTRH